MKNPTGKKLEKLVFGIFDQMVEGADKYVTKQGSTWLIFTESKKWVIEFTKDKTLWFNYNVFQNELDLIGKDCTEERDLIKNWFESRFLNKPKVWATFNHAIDSNQAVEDTIQNGVKEAHHVDVMKFFDKKMENTIENGVKDTKLNNRILDLKVEDAIQEGVKRTFDMEFRNQLSVEDTIQEGVKYTIDEKSTFRYVVEDTIQNGVKDTQTRMWPPVGAVGETIQNGVKETKENWSASRYQVEDTIENGVKETQMMGNDREIIVAENIYDEKKHTIIHKTTVFDIVDDIIQNGVKETKEDRLFRTIHVMNAIVNGVKHVEDGDWLDQDERIDDIIESGVKETKHRLVESWEQKDHLATTFEITENINDAIENGVKELKVWKSNRCEEHGYFEFVDGIPTYTPMTQVKDVLENGVKEIQPLPAQDGNRDWGLYYHRQEDRTKPHTEYVKEVIEDSYNHRGRVEGVIRNTDKDGI